MLWICFGRRICLREYHGTIERIMLPISTSVGETTDDVTQITRFVDGPFYSTPSKISETFLTPTTCEGKSSLITHPSNPLSPILSPTDSTRAFTSLHPTLLSPAPQSLVYHQQCDHYFTPHIYFNLSGLGYLIDSFFVAVCCPFSVALPPLKWVGTPTFAYTSRKILCICFSPSYLVPLLYLFGGQGVGMDLHELFYIL